MSVTWGARPESERVTTNPKGFTVGYVLTGTTDRNVAAALAAGYSSALSGTLYRSNISLDHQGMGVWFVDITYGPYEKKEREAGDFKWGFTVGGGSVHITQAIAHVEEYVSLFTTDVAVDHKGTIGLNENGDVEGADVPDFAFEWNEDRSLLLATYGWTYVQSVLSSVVNHVNDDTFRGFPAGSVLLKQAEGGQSAKDPLFLDVTFHFAYSPNRTDITIGDITGIAKKGWEYLWVEYRTGDPGAALRRPKRPCQVNVEQIFYEADFSLLGIGTT